jgi:Fe-S cluster assembly iron-binding protein IscA
MADIEVTQYAIEVLKRSLALAPHAAGVRLRAATALGGGVSVQIELADGPLAGETEIEAGDVRIFVDPALADAVPHPVVDVATEHERVVVRPRTTPAT